MKIHKGSVWHTYTMHVPIGNLSKKLISNLMSTGMFLSAYDKDRDFYYIENGKVRVNSTFLDFNASITGVRAEGFPTKNDCNVCDLTRFSIHLLVNKLLSQTKILQTDGTFYNDTLYLIFKPVIINDENDNKILCPVVSLYDIGIAQVNFIDLADHEDDLGDFIKKNVNFNFVRSNSITTSLDYALCYQKYDKSISPLHIRVVLRNRLKDARGILINTSEYLDIGGVSSSGKYTDYADVTGVSHSLSDIARTMIALVSFNTGRLSFKEFFYGKDFSDFYGKWQGKPNIFIMKHDNQRACASLNHKVNRKMIGAMLTKNAFYFSEGKKRDYHDFRAFDDFNYFSEQGVSLSILSKKSLCQLENNESYSFENFKWDNLVKSDLRELVSYFYEGQLTKINNVNDNMELAKIKNNIFNFEEWLRHSSKRSGEVQDYIIATFEYKDIKASRRSIESLIKSKMEIIKMQDADSNERANKNLTLIFGLVATTSLSPVLIKPVFDYCSITDLIISGGYKGFADAIYFFAASILVFLLIIIFSPSKK